MIITCGQGSDRGQHFRNLFVAILANISGLEPEVEKSCGMMKMGREREKKKKKTLPEEKRRL